MSPAQQTANRANARLSTGPRTPEGKSRSNMNALRHGLTGRIVVLPTEDMAEFQRFSKLMIESLAPANTAEQELVQTISDTQWRINRILSIEDGMFALGHFEIPASIDTEDPAINSVMSQAQAFRDDSKSFVNLSIYEQRLHRTMEKAHKRLSELQTARNAARQLEEAEAARLGKTQQPNEIGNQPSANGFVYASPESDPGTEPQTRPEQAICHPKQNLEYHKKAA